MKLINLIYIIIFSGCAFSTHYIQNGGQKYPETNMNNIMVYTDEPANDYIVIGSIAADAPGDYNAALTKLRQEASEIGADAVIYVKLNKVSTYSARTGISGVAVKWQ